MKPLSVYVHLPFCERRCGYCDFVSCCAVDQIDQYLAKLCAEIRGFDFTNYEVKTIYLGGGTPSLLTPEQLRRLFAVLPACDGEVTIEANPNSLTREKCRAYRELGINRISIGVQSFDDVTLRDLGRLHDVKQALAAINLAHEFFDNISIDLIKDIPAHPFVQPPDVVFSMIKHISIYSLTKNDQPVLETDESVRLPKLFHRYEVSNYALKGFESRHNLVYWTGGEYIGFGAGAHSLLNNQRFYNSDDIFNYRRGAPHTRTAEEVRHEQIMLGLRLRTGVDKSLLKNKDAEIALLQTHGYIKVANDKIIPTTKGLKMLNQIWLKLS